MYNSADYEFQNTEGRDLEVSVDRVLKDDNKQRKARWFSGHFLAIGAVIVVLIAATVGVAVWLRRNNQETIPSGMTDGPIALSTLSQRNTVDDCWIAFYGNVYDMTQYIRKCTCAP
jgi:cytochrome b involved in lipid metabolism